VTIRFKKESVANKKWKCVRDTLRQNYFLLRTSHQSDERFGRIACDASNLFIDNWRQAEACTMCLVGAVDGERSCPIPGATAIHSAPLHQKHNLPIERRTLYH